MMKKLIIGILLSASVLMASLGANAQTVAKPKSPTPAQRAGDFLNSICYNSNLYGYVTPDIDLLTILTNLQYVGGRCIRIEPNSAADQFLVNEALYLAQNGIQLDLGAPLNEDTPNLIVSNLTAALELYQTFALNPIVTIEQPNEPPNTNYVYSGSTSSPSTSPGFLPVASFSSVFYDAVRAIANLNQIPIISTSLAGQDVLDNGLQWLNVPNGYAHATLTTNASTSASSTLHFAATGAANLQDGEYVYAADTTDGAPLGTISSFTGTTVVLSGSVTVSSGTAIRFGARVPDATNFADIYNLHVYPMYGELCPAQQYSAALVDPATCDYIQQQIKDNYSAPIGSGNMVGPTTAQVNSGKIYITEWGYGTGTTGANSPNVDQTTQGKQILDGILDAWLEGIKKTFIYELFDPAASCGDLCFGLYTFAETPKSAATWMHNLITVLADTSPTRNSFEPGSLPVTVTGLPTGGQTLLFQVANGTYFLVIWPQVNDWNHSTGAEISISATTVTVTFHDVAGTYNVYDPTVGTTSQANGTNGTVNVSITDYPKIVSFH